MVPWDLLEKTTQLRHVRFWIKGLVLLMVMLGSAYLVVYQGMEIQKKKFPHQSMTGDQVASKIAAIGKLQDQIQAIQDKTQSLSTLAQDQVFFDILGRFSHCLNDQAWITALSIKQDPEKSHTAILECEGGAWGHHSLGLFLNRLAQMRGIRQVILENADNMDATGRDSQGMTAPVETAVRFKISARIERASSR